MTLTFKLRYRGRLAQPSQVISLADEVEDICRSNSWPFQRWNEDWTLPPAVIMDIQENRLEVEGHVPLKGITIQPHPECETVWLTFTPDGILNSLLTLGNPIWTGDDRDYPWSRVKTGFDGTHTHELLCNLFFYLKDKFFADFECNDETGYWMHRDKARLTKMVTEAQHDYALLQNELAALEIENKLDAPTKSAISTKLLKEFGQKHKRWTNE